MNDPKAPPANPQPPQGAPPPGTPPAAAAPGAPPAHVPALGTEPPPPTAAPTAPAAPAAPPRPAPHETEPTRMVKSSRREKKVRERRGGTGVLLVARPGIPPTPLTLTRARTIIGRDRDSCDVVLEDDGVSRQHASVSRESTGYFALHDLGSKNGIFVGGHRVDRRTLLHGDTFKIGDTTFTFQLIPDKTDKPAAPLPPPGTPPPAAAAPPPGAPPPPPADPNRK